MDERAAQQARELARLIAEPHDEAACLAFRDGPGSTPLVELVLSAPAPAVDELRLAVYAGPAAPGLGLARVQVALAGRDWPDLAGVSVALRWAGSAARPPQTPGARPCSPARPSTSSRPSASRRRWNREEQPCN